MTEAQQIETANAKYESTFDQGDLPIPPLRRVAIVTCMDARIDPAESLGIGLGEAHVIRNAGGRASEALRSLIISQRLLNTNEIILFHHTDCGMLTFSDDHIRRLLRDQTGVSADHIAFLPFRDLTKSVKEDVEYLQKHPLIADVPISGYVYDVKTGGIAKVD